VPRNSKLLVLLLAGLFVAASAFSLDLTRTSRAAQNGAVLVQDSRAYGQDVDKLLRRYDKLEMDQAIVAAQVQETGRIFVPTSSGGFDITLTPHDMRAARYRAQEVTDGGVVRELERSPARTYKGVIAGMPDGQARLTIDNETFEGLIITPGQIYFIEPAQRFSATAGPRDFVVYQQSDLLQGSLGECGVTTLAQKVSAETLRVESRSRSALSADGKIEEFFSPPRTIDLATEADFEYFTFFGGATTANNEILSIMNQVEGIYDSHFGLQFTIVFQNVWSTASDPYTSTAASTALDQFTNYWNTNHASLNRDLAHMWTGKSFDGNTIGIAWQPGLDCPLGPSGYGMSERLSSTPGKFVVTAHEIGHNFNAQHADAQPNCANTIMGTTLNAGTSQTFCPFSVSEIEARANAKVACLAQALTPGCTYSLSSSAQSVGSSGGSGSVIVNTVGTNCAWAADSAVEWIIITSGNSGTNSGIVNFAVGPNTNGFARSGLIRIAEQNFLVHQVGSANCVTQPISVGQAVINATLALSDCRSSERPNTFADHYAFAGAAGETVRIEMDAVGVSTFDTYLYLIGPSGTVIAENDDITAGSDLDSRIPVNGFLTLPTAGTYIIEATSYNPNTTGTYDLRLSSGSPNTVQFSQLTPGASEGAGRVDITVTRTGNTTGEASVKYSTSDNAGLTNCNVTNNVASSRCDYAAVVGTLNFAANETSKSFSIPVVDDSYAENGENFVITLSNPAGTQLGAPSTTIVQISDNETSNGPNPIVGTAFFVRQHYIDFLGREPDPGGFQAWQDTINNCPAGNTTCDRIHVSGNFFQSPEFQARGYFVYRFYPVAFGRKPDYAEFIPDLARVSGFLSDTQLEAAKVAFVNEFINRQAFAATYNGLSNTQYVDTLLATAGVTSSNRDFWIAALGNGTRTRATVLRDISESIEVYNKYYNQAFVVMQYFGYLRRDPDASYLNWIQELDTTGNSRNMINGFVNSLEYRFRFGP
jgi:hypothetical protein